MNMAENHVVRMIGFTNLSFLNSGSTGKESCFCSMTDAFFFDLC